MHLKRKLSMLNAIVSNDISTANLVNILHNTMNKILLKTKKIIDNI